MTAKASCPTCSREQADWLMCKGCVNGLKSNLNDLSGLLRELDTNLTRQSKMGVQGGPQGKGQARPLPYDVGAMSVIDKIKAELVASVRELDLGDTVGLADNCRALTHWLLARVERIRGHAAANEIVDGIKKACKDARHAIDRPADKILIGNCSNPNDATDAAGGLIKCPTMYARRGDKKFSCPSCKAEYDVAEKRVEMLRLVEHQWATVATCSKVLATFGVEVKADTIQNWARRDKLDKRGEDSGGHSLYRVGDVISLTHEAQQWAQARQSERDAKKARRLEKVG